MVSPKRIISPPAHKQIIRKELKISMQSVDFALRYVTNSQISHKVRQRAKELLEQEAKEVVIDLNNQDEEQLDD